MRKFILLLLCFIFYGYCFSQTQTIKDSSKITSRLLDTVIQNTKDKPRPELMIYPNPANNKITLQVKNYDPGMVTVKLLDIKGKTVKEDTRLITNGTEEIVMFLMLKAGVYFVIVTGPGKIVRKKLVISQ